MESGLRMVQYTYWICMGLGPRILSVIAKSLAYSGPPYPSSSLQNDAKNLKKMTETLAHRYSSESTRRELSNEY